MELERPKQKVNLIVVYNIMSHLNALFDNNKQQICLTYTKTLLVVEIVTFASIRTHILLLLQKKTKRKTTSNEADEQPTTFVTLADVDVDVFPSTSICDDIPSQECLIAAEQSVDENQQCESFDEAVNEQAHGKDMGLYILTICQD